MKQLLFLILIVGIGYFLFKGGIGRVLSKANINTKGLITDITQTVDENFIPDTAPERSNFKVTNSNSLARIRENVFITYDPDICFSMVDLVYSSGSTEALSYINEYLSMFSLPEDKAKVLNLLSQYKDRQTLSILITLYKNGSLGRSNLLNVLSAYHTAEVAQIIHNAAASSNDSLAQTAKKLEKSFAEEKWYKNGLEAKVSDDKIQLKDYDSRIEQMAQE